MFNVSNSNNIESENPEVIESLEGKSGCIPNFRDVAFILLLDSEEAVSIERKHLVKRQYRAEIFTY